MYLFMVFTYLKLCVYDYIDYYYTYLILSLPAYMFITPVINIWQINNPDEESSDDDAMPEKRNYSLFISQFMFVLKTNDTPPTMTTRSLNGLQLKVLLDDKGRFFISHIQRYYPTLDTIIIRYSKTQIFDGQLSNANSEHTKVIDVVKRYDLRNSKSCKFGVVL